MNDELAISRGFLEERPGIEPAQVVSASIMAVLAIRTDRNHTVT